MKMSWYETSSNFWIVDRETGREECMGDGVDMFSTEDGDTLDVCSDAFYEALDKLMEDPETYEAYFG